MTQHPSSARRRVAPHRAGALAIASSLFVLLAACSAGGAGSTAPSTLPSTNPTASPTTGASAPAPSEPAASGLVIQVADSALGPILSDQDGNTVYLFTPDSANTSTCGAGCIDTWPPVSLANGEAATAGDGVTATLGTITRDDGTVQVTVNELPIYYFAGDTAAGQTNGQNVGGKWFVVSADGSMNHGAAASTGAYGRDGY
jgi:predicted lipoprotein with Yx(FWY)xxD motif